MARAVTREEAYRDGWHEGRLWAESDLRDGLDARTKASDIRSWVHTDKGESDQARAWNLGIARGYRQAVADYDSGRTSWETFEHLPLGKELR